MLTRDDRLDLLRAYATVSGHRFPQYVVCQNLPSLNKQLDIGHLDDGEGQSIACSYYSKTNGFCHDCIALIDGLEDIMSFIRTTKANATQPEAYLFQPLLEGLVHRLLRKEPGVALDGISTLINGCCRLAVLILVDAMVREAFGSPAYTDHHVRRIKSDLLPMNTGLGRALYWLMVATLHGQKVDLGEPARGMYVAEAVLLAIDISENTWRLARDKILDYLELRKTNELVDTNSLELWELGPISQIIIEDWI